MPSFVNEFADIGVKTSEEGPPPDTVHSLKLAALRILSPSCANLRKVCTSRHVLRSLMRRSGGIEDALPYADGCVQRRRPRRATWSCPKALVLTAIAQNSQYVTSFRQPQSLVPHLDSLLESIARKDHAVAHSFSIPMPLSRTDILLSMVVGVIDVESDDVS
jgi:hypothetical protein